MTTKMTPAELAEAEALAGAATPGPWRVTADGYDVTSDVAEHDIADNVDTGDAALIAASRTLVPRLLASHRAVEAERDEARGERNEARRDRNKAEAEADFQLVPRDMFPSAATAWDRLRAERDEAHRRARSVLAIADRECSQTDDDRDRLRAELAKVTAERDAAKADLAFRDAMYEGTCAALLTIAKERDEALASLAKKVGVMGCQHGNAIGDCLGCVLVEQRHDGEAALYLVDQVVEMQAERDTALAELSAAREEIQRKDEALAAAGATDIDGGREFCRACRFFDCKDEMCSGYIARAALAPREGGGAGDAGTTKEK